MRQTWAQLADRFGARIKKPLSYSDGFEEPRPSLYYADEERQLLHVDIAVLDQLPDDEIRATISAQFGGKP